MTKLINPLPSVAAENSRFRALIPHISKFAGGMVGTILLCLGAYAMMVDQMVTRSGIPATYKWFLLKEVPGPRIVFESGSNSHHAIDTQTVGAALGMTAINISDNAGYALEDKISRLETFSRAGDIIVLPLEWSFYKREKLTDAYVESIFSESRDYYRTLPPLKRLKRALSLPPETIITELKESRSQPSQETESPAHQLFVTALSLPTGHYARPNSSGPGFGVAGQSCDDYILGAPEVRQDLKLGKNIKPALARLKKLQARGINIHFAWPVLAGEGCMTDPAYVKGFKDEIEQAVNQAGFEFLGSPEQSLYGQDMQDDTPYHLIAEGTDAHTQQMIGFLRAQGYVASGEQLNIKDFARHRLFELELAEIKSLKQPGLPVEQEIRMEDQNFRPHVEFSAGWWVFEKYGRWMRDNRAMFRITLPETLPENAILEIRGITKSRVKERVHITIGGELMAAGDFADGVPLRLPVANLPRGKTLSVFLDLPNAGVPRSPFEKGESEDARSMTLHLQSMKITVAPEDIVTSPPLVKSGDEKTTTATNISSISKAYKPTSISGKSLQRIALDQPISATNTRESVITQSLIQYGEGWWEQESEGRWMRSKEASFNVTLPQSVSGDALERYTLELTGTFFSERPQTVDILIDGQNVGTAKVTGTGIGSFSFETANAAADVNVTLKFSIPNLKSPIDLGLSTTDERTLTFFLKSMKLQLT